MSSNSYSAPPCAAGFQLATCMMRLLQQKANYSSRVSAAAAAPAEAHLQHASLHKQQASRRKRQLSCSTWLGLQVQLSD